jgi:glycosyltransferase involved in cell wall biosynthesis
VHFLGQHPVEIARAVMAKSHLGIVSLSPGVSKVAYPSKLMTYVDSGCPVFALIESDSSVAGDVRAHDLGYVCSERTPEAVARAIVAASQDKRRWDAAGRAGLRERAAKKFGRDIALAQWRALFRRLGAEAREERPSAVAVTSP